MVAPKPPPPPPNAGAAEAGGLEGVVRPKEGAEDAATAEEVEEVVAAGAKPKEGAAEVAVVEEVDEEAAARNERNMMYHII